MTAGPRKHHPVGPPSSSARVKAPGGGRPVDRHVPGEDADSNRSADQGTPETSVAIDDGRFPIDIEASRWFG